MKKCKNCGHVAKHESSGGSFSGADELGPFGYSCVACKEAGKECLIDREYRIEIDHEFRKKVNTLQSLSDQDEKL